MTVQVYTPSAKVQIECSDKAKARLIKVITTSPEALGMRLSVKKTGCSGYAYDLQVITSLVQGDLCMDLDAEHKLYIDNASYAFLEGLQMDYVQQGLQAKFVYINPKQTGQCGCGESFSVK